MGLPSSNICRAAAPIVILQEVQKCSNNYRVHQINKQTTNQRNNKECAWGRTVLFVQGLHVCHCGRNSAEAKAALTGGMIAASKFLPIIGKVTKIAKTAIRIIWAKRRSRSGRARSTSLQSFIVIIDSAKKIRREMLLIIASSGSFRSNFSLLSAIFLKIAAAVIAPTEAGNSTPVCFKR